MPAVDESAKRIALPCPVVKGEPVVVTSSLAALTVGLPTDTEVATLLAPKKLLAAPTVKLGTTRFSV